MVSKFATCSLRCAFTEFPSLLLSYPGVKFRRKDNNPDLIDIIIPKEWLGEEHSLKLNEMEVDSSFAKKVIKSEGSSSKRKPEKTVEVKKEENKPEPTMDWTSSHKGNGKGKAKEENQHLLSGELFL